jgi:hypothetical protein
VPPIPSPTFADACRAAGVGFSFGYGVDTRVQAAVEILNTHESWEIESQNHPPGTEMHALQHVAIPRVGVVPW